MRAVGFISKPAAQSRFARQRLGFALAFALLAAGCGGRPPAVYVGESQHFRLYVDPELLPLPAAFAGDNALAALETQWSDVATMLKMPDRKIMYYWYTLAHASEACGDTREGGCTKEEDMEIDAPLLPDAHELTHAYTYLRAPRRPIPFLAEGLAEAIGCEEQPIPTNLNADWRQAVAEVQSLNVYGVGGMFVRRMIRKHGIDEFMRYYEQSPERRDPALFAANFESFWGESLDDVWPVFNTVQIGVSWTDQKICPCSLPALAPSTRVVDDPARAPYWTLPDLGDDTIALTTPPGGGYQRVNVRDCAGVLPGMSGTAVLARLGSGAGWYVTPPIGSVAIDRFAADTCVEAARYQLSPDILIGDGYLSVTVPAVGSGSTIYLALDVPFDAEVHGATGGICDTCGFDQERCQAVPPGAAPVSGTFYTRLQYYTGPATHDVNTLALRFSP